MIQSCGIFEKKINIDKIVHEGELINQQIDSFMLSQIIQIPKIEKEEGNKFDLGLELNKECLNSLYQLLRQRRNVIECIIEGNINRNEREYYRIVDTDKYPYFGPTTGHHYDKDLAKNDFRRSESNQVGYLRQVQIFGDVEFDKIDGIEIHNWDEPLNDNSIHHLIHINNSSW